jgi:hypothetical protein
MRHLCATAPGYCSDIKTVQKDNRSRIAHASLPWPPFPPLTSLFSSIVYHWRYQRQRHSDDSVSETKLLT